MKDGHGKHYGSKTVADTLTERSISFIKENKDKPFLLYLSHFDVHTPIRAKSEVVEKYKKKLAAKDWGYEWNTTYAAMIEAFDKSIGKVKAALEEAGIAKRTLLIVTSDNGGTGATITGPLKGAKGSFAEGGIRIPTVMSWPGVIKAGSRCDTPITSVDLLPTLADLSGASLPEQHVDGKSFVPLLEGKEMAKRGIFWHYPMYLSSTGRPVVPIHGTDKMYWRAVPASVVVEGSWKLTYYYEDKSVKLYNVDDDPGEKKELSKVHPEKTSLLKEKLLSWVKETGAPMPSVSNPDFSNDLN